MKKIYTRKFIALASVIAWIVFLGFAIWLAYLWGDKDLLTYVTGSIAGTVGIIVGFYFGKSTAIEGVAEGAAHAEHMEEKSGGNNGH